MKKNSWGIIVILALLGLCSHAQAQDAPDLQQQLQNIQRQAIISTNAPSKSPSAQKIPNPLGVSVPEPMDPPPAIMAANTSPNPTMYAQVTPASPVSTTTTTLSPSSNQVVPVQPATPETLANPPSITAAETAVTGTPAAGAAAAGAPKLTQAQLAAKTNALLTQGGVPSVEENLRDEAFARMTTSALPLSPTQIELLRNLYDATQRAAAIYPGTPPRPTVASVAVNLSPGATPPVIRLNAGLISSLVFVDSTGAPWPIDSYSLGNPSAYNIQWDKRSNILLVQAITAYRTGNMAVILKGLNTPVMIDFIPGQAAVDTRVDLRVPGFGPQAKQTFISLPSTEDPNLLNLLSGIPPMGARSLRTTGCENCAWILNDKLYLRTQFTILSPGWISTVMSADGTHAYVMQPTPMILTTYNGKTITISIEGY